MDSVMKSETPAGKASSTGLNGKAKNRSVDTDNAGAVKRRCVSTACIACRRRKSKCDGNLPKCAACASVYLTECEYAPHTDHRRKGVYKKDADSLRTKNSALQTLIHALLNYEEDDAFDLLRQIRACDNLEELANAVENHEKGLDIGSPDSPIYGNEDLEVPRFEAELSGRVGDLVIDGSVKFIGGTSNLIWLNEADDPTPASPTTSLSGALQPREEAVLSWTNVTKDRDLILHFINLYFCWHYAYFTTLSKELFYRDFLTGKSSQYCSSLLVNAMLALGCHFSSRPAARSDPDNSSTTGDHFFLEARTRLHENDEFAEPKLCTVQALALMSVREAGCGRESTGWVYSGMSFRMASDLGLNVDIEKTNSAAKLSDSEVDARRITFWGCFTFDKCWSNYLGRQPQLLPANIDVRKPEVFASEDSELWSPYTDSGLVSTNNQPARTRAVALQIFRLGEISSDLLSSFYNPHVLDKPTGKQAELRKLSDIHTRLESWKKELPAELDPKDGQLPQVLLMHMFYQLLYIHLYRPFLKYTKTTSPLPAHVSPRKFCTQAAGAISKLFRLYKRTHGLRQICNIAVYIAHSACTIHLLNLPDKNAKRDIVHGVKQLEEIGECWTCARRTLRILALCAEKWKIQLPQEIQAPLIRIRQRWESVESPHTSVSLDTIPTIPLGAMMADEQAIQSLASLEQPDPSSLLAKFAHDKPTFESTPNDSNNAGLMLPAQIPASTQQAGQTTKGKPTLRPLAKLTKAQQDAWNAHQARMAHFPEWSQTPSSSIDPLQTNAAVLFGGVDSLMEEPRDWWLKDQSQLAVGFDNWNAPAPDWSQVGVNGISIPLGDAVDPMTSPVDSSQYFGGSDVTAATFSNGPSPNQGSYPFPAAQNHPIAHGTLQQQHQRQHQQHQQAQAQAQAQHQQQHMQQRQPMADMNTIRALSGSGAMATNANATKRMNTFDNETMYY